MKWVFVFLFIGRALSANCLPEDIIKDEYLVRLKPSDDISFQSKSQSSYLSDLLNDEDLKVHVIHNQDAKRAMILSKAKASEVPPTLLHVKVSGSKVYDLTSDPSVLSVEQNCVVHLQATPNDTSFSRMWGHQVIHTEEAWDISTGSKDVIAAISDTGVDYNHEDLKDNMWVNELEKNGTPGVDDDGNGYVDDIYGYDFANGDGDPKPGTANGYYHGTHVAGTVGAVGNNALGVTGIVWKTKLMAVKGFPDASAGGSLDALLSTIYYAADNGARVVNCSWGGARAPTSAERDAIRYALQKGMVPVVAAGNDTQNASGFAPAGVAEALTVGASNSLDQLATFSNFGTIVDVIAPGGDVARGGRGLNETIYSTYPMNAGKYNGIQGTSMAAPHVAGLATLLFSINPNLSAQEVIDMIKSTGDLVDVEASDASLSKFTYPRINAFKAAAAAQGTLPPPDDENPPCTGDQCSQSGIGTAKELAQFNSNGCDYSVAASMPIQYGFIFLFLPILLVFFKRD
ncbi:MAG: S8 family serine peptidase [Bdellovibrionales bacterium]|nr:S8 family serine peptidase [Bdellovibrionales bacterium]